MGCELESSSTSSSVSGVVHLHRPCPDFVDPRSATRLRANPSRDLPADGSRAPPAFRLRAALPHENTRDFETPSFPRRSGRSSATRGTRQPRTHVPRAKGCGRTSRAGVASAAFDRVMRSWPLTSLRAIATDGRDLGARGRDRAEGRAEDRGHSHRPVASRLIRREARSRSKTAFEGDGTGMWRRHAQLGEDQADGAGGGRVDTRSFSVVAFRSCGRSQGRVVRVVRGQEPQFIESPTHRDSANTRAFASAFASATATCVCACDLRSSDLETPSCGFPPQSLS